MGGADVREVWWSKGGRSKGTRAAGFDVGSRVGQRDGNEQLAGQLLARFGGIRRQVTVGFGEWMSALCEGTRGVEDVRWPEYVVVW